MDYITDTRGERVETREGTGSFRIELNNTDALSLDFTRTYELLEEGFPIAEGVDVPAGAYSFQTVRTGYQFGQQRPVSGSVNVAAGSFFGGDRTQASTSGRVELTPRFSFEPSESINWVELPEGTFTSRLAATRVIFAPSPRSVLSALHAVQLRQRIAELERSSFRALSSWNHRLPAGVTVAPRRPPQMTARRLT